MHRIIPNQLKHQTFLNLIKCGFDAAFKKFNFKISPSKEIKDVAQARILEDVSNADILEFSGRRNEATSAQVIMHYHKFDNTHRNFRKPNKIKVMRTRCAARCIASNCVPHLNSRLAMLMRKFNSATSLASPTISPSEIIPHKCIGNNPRSQ